jgi:hypothetical protein
MPKDTLAARILLPSVKDVIQVPVSRLRFVELPTTPKASTGQDDVASRCQS